MGAVVRTAWFLAGFTLAALVYELAALTAPRLKSTKDATLAPAWQGAHGCWPESWGEA